MLGMVPTWQSPPFISNDISSVDAMTNIENHPISIVQVVRYQKINTKN